MNDINSGIIYAYGILKFSKARSLLSAIVDANADLIFFYRNNNQEVLELGKI